MGLMLEPRYRVQQNHKESLIYGTLYTYGEGRGHSSKLFS